MKQLYSFLLVLAAFATLPACAQHKTAELEWQTDLMKAQELSLKTNRPIFGFFTGSDWCGWCHKLERDVFSKPSFIKFAKEKVVLLELDFPRQKPQPQELQQQNGSLQQAFRVQGYPTIWYFTMKKDSASGQMLITPWGSQGYPAGSEPGKEDVKFLDEAKKILEKQGKS